jgi:hypothetical protein
MKIDLTFQDLMKLAENESLEKDGVTLAISRPILPEVKADPKAKTGTVTFSLDENDDRRLTAF